MLVLLRDVTLTSEMSEVECEDGSMMAPLSASFVVSSGLPLRLCLHIIFSVSHKI